jgi:hypothetical protein
MFSLSNRDREVHIVSMKWLNETSRTRVLAVFAGGVAVVVLWKALECPVGNRES